MRKKYVLSSIFVMLFLALVLPAVNLLVNGGELKVAQADAAQANTAQEKISEEKSKILIVYFSHSGNTRSIAKQIHSRVGGDVLELQTINPYPTDYNTVVRQAKEELASGYKPPLKNKISNIADYDIIFIGTPVWWGTIAPPIATFLSEYDLAGKTIIPFCTHAGSRQGRCFTDIAMVCQNSKIMDGIAISGNAVENAQQELEAWLQKINLL